jgi:hypothetical protein
MVCYECGMSLASSREISVKFGVPLCGNYLLIIEKNLKKHFYGLHVANLYYALKKQGLNPFIGLVEWEKICPYIPRKTKN